MLQKQICLGGVHKDERGVLKFFNTFDMSIVQRFYVLEHPNTTAVRAWQGHQKEQKWFYVTDGIFKLVLVKPDNWKTPSLTLPCEELLLRADNNQIINIPAGFATGLQALEASSKIIVFSDVRLGESVEDDYRFDKSLWYKW
ncbi:MAG TPA: hypothetical protein VGE24_08120 [Emticicia sp.]